MEEDETTPLLTGERSPGRVGRSNYTDQDSDPHTQFCTLTGVPSSDKTKRQLPQKHDEHNTTLYSRATHQRRAQIRTYGFTAALSNTLLLSQVVLGATLTALGASESSHVLITVFGVLNTVIAGTVAYLKSRGQPMRARMFRDDLEHLVDEIENSEIMWLGISKHMHGYDEIDIDDKVSVRSEVARLTRLYESAVKRNTSNNPDMYMSGSALDPLTGLRARPAAGAQLPPVLASAADPVGTATVAGATAPTEDPDESPATAKVLQPDTKTGKDVKDAPASSKDADARPSASKDPDASPATAKDPVKQDKDKAGA